MSSESTGPDRLEETEGPHPSTGATDTLASRITGEEFAKWYRDHKWAENIREGTAFFNGPSETKPPHRHSPSQLLKCQRKTYYRQLNAPEETEDPAGIYWFGSLLEEQLIIPFLENLVGENEYITNSIWVSFTESTGAGEIEISGATDPVIVNREAEPQLLTEVKSKRSLDNQHSVNLHHKAQAHAYMRGLTRKYDRDISEAIIIYISRNSLDLQSFRIDFDSEFWQETVLDWMESHTTHRLHKELPEPEPVFEWECDFCPYKERCGMGEKEFSDAGPSGLLPLFKYPRSKLETYLKVHGGKLTPSLAKQYPDLIDEYGVYDFYCRGCDSTYNWASIDWSGNVKSPPRCPRCESRGHIRLLKGPTPDEQVSGEGIHEV